MRLDKFLCDNNIGTRSQVKEYIKKGQVTVNDQIIKKPETKVNEETDTVVCQGQPIHYRKYVYYMLNKPEGVVSATNDNTAPTVVSLLTVPEQKDLFPVGRLDKDTEGLLLLTDNGPLGHALLSPKRHVDKVYLAYVDGVVDQSDVEALARGMVLGDGLHCLPAGLEPLEDGRACLVTLREGKYHQVKRMMAARGKPVTYLKRLSMGPLRLDKGLAPGEWRPLTWEEVLALSRFG